ncbi:MAG: hypothetical protein P4L51_08480 [Puia sp.]|nr:hypothetical protein [Puia sp.]
MPIKTFTSLAISLVTYSLTIGQQTALGQEKTPQDTYNVVNRTLSSEEGTGTIHLNEADGVGIAWIKGREFKEGAIEFDIKGKDAFQQSFVGFAFHGSNDTTYEAVYFRPFNFRSADAVRKTHAVQYIAGPKYDWPKLRAGYPGKYEQPISAAPDPNAWFHAKIVVTAQKIAVFVDGNETPCLTVAPLVQSTGRQIGYWVGNGSAGDWKNLQIRPLSQGQ